MGEGKELVSNIRFKRFNRRLNNAVYIIAAAFLWVLALLFLHKIEWPIRVTTATTVAAVFLWIFSKFSLALVSFMAVTVLIITKAIPLNLGLSGFATGSLFLILTGLMLAQAINDTEFAQRTAYFVLGRFGGTPGGALAGIFLILLILSFFVPSAAVRITLLLPTVKVIIERAGENCNKRNLTCLLIIGLAFGATVTGTGVLPAALANVMTADLIYDITGERITYVKWFLYTFPVSLVLLPILWFVLVYVFPTEMKEFPGGAEEFRKRLAMMEPFSVKEKKCLAILGLAMFLWVTEGIHGLHSAVPAMLAVILFCMPGIGFMDFKKMLSIDWSTIFLVGFTLSLGAALNETGTANFLAGQIFNKYSLRILTLSPALTVFVVSTFTQIVHIFLGNVTTLVVTLIPLISQIAFKLNIDPVMLGLVTGITGLHGFLLPVETISNMVVYGTGYLQPYDMIKPGIFITLSSIIVLSLAAYLWWPLVGLI